MENLIENESFLCYFKNVRHLGKIECLSELCITWPGVGVV